MRCTQKLYRHLRWRKHDLTVVSPRGTNVPSGDEPARRGAAQPAEQGRRHPLAQHEPAPAPPALHAQLMSTKESPMSQSLDAAGEAVAAADDARPAPGQEGRRQRHLRLGPGMVRLRRLRRHVGHRVPRPVLPPDGRDRGPAGLVRHLRGRLLRPAARRDGVRSPRRQVRPAPDPAHHLHLHGRGVDGHRPAAAVLLDRRPRPAPPRAHALRAGLRPRRRGHRRAADDHGARAPGPAGLLRRPHGHGLPDLPGGRQPHARRALRRPDRGGVHVVGLAGAVPAEHPARGGRHLHPRQGRGDPGLPGGGEGGRPGDRQPRGGAAHPRLDDRSA